MKKSIEEFKAFINKGNAIDLAVGLVMGTAFNNIIKSLVTHIITPFISLLGEPLLPSCLSCYEAPQPMTN